MKTPTLVSAVSIITVIIISYTYLNRYRFIEENTTISVKGMGTTDFTSDRIVWEGNFNRENKSLKNAYAELSQDREVVLAFLTESGISNEEIVFGSVSTSEVTKNIYNDEGNYIDQEFLGYKLTQDVKIESSNLDLVERASRSITEVLNNGVQFYSDSPRYYYTGLKDLKLDLLSKATADAKARASIIATEAGADIGELKSAEMGILQIVGQYSDDDYSWGGTFNTSSKLKTASITIDLSYELVN